MRNYLALNWAISLVIHENAYGSFTCLCKTRAFHVEGLQFLRKKVREFVTERFRKIRFICIVCICLVIKTPSENEKPQINSSCRYRLN